MTFARMLTSDSRFLRLSLAGVVLLGCATASNAAEPGDEDIEFFEKRIRPVLVEHCYQCHSAEAARAKRLKAELRLDSRAGMQRGGASGPAIVPGKPGESLLISALQHEDIQMPPSGKLPDAVVADFVHWIDRGAPDPRVDNAAPTDEKIERGGAREFWSFQRPVRRAPPAVQNHDWPATAIDRFVLARLEAAGLKPAPPADKRALIRRVYCDLIGLPPDPDAVEAFVRDDSPGAFAKVVDRLLASPHFGERWGRHWMDVVRYADSVGGGSNFVFDNAWRYRDWIIQALNADMPYDEFLVQQIAGDLLPAENPQQKRRQIVATGFLAIGRKELPEYDKQKLRMDVVDEQIDTLGKALLGLSLGCARCHDHKFDPIETRDYYALAGIFESTQTLSGKRSGPHSTWVKINLPGSSGQAIAVQEARQKVDSRICIRGDVHRRGEAVPRGFVEVLTTENTPQINRSQSGRLQLARWIAARENPLTARVLVNRIWNWLFGAGLVRSVDNFGTRGELPSHPELLDHLAVQLMDDDWSLKRTIRRIVLSRTYRLSSRFDPQAAAEDPENRLLWRFQRRRLEAEIIRDAMLALGGTLDRRQFGNTLTFTGRLDEGKEKPRGANPGRRRSVYLPRYRETKLSELMQAFDVAHPALVTGDRRVTTVPTQALFLMNSSFVMDQARSTARRLLAQGDLSDEQRLDLAYRLAYARPPSDGEMEQDKAFLDRVERLALLLADGETRRREDGGQRDQAASLRRVREQAWMNLCQSLLVSNEFLFVE